MTSDKGFISNKDLTERIKERTQGLETGSTSLSALDELLDDLRELEERIIVIRYKGLERLRMKDIPLFIPAAGPSTPYVPETPAPSPLNPVMDAKPNAYEHKVEEPIVPLLDRETPSDTIPTNQISLIDSIEELSNGVVEEKVRNEQTIETPKPPAPKLNVRKDDHQTSLSYAEKMEQRPVGNIKKELNLNQRLGLAKVLAPDDDKGLDRILSSVDLANGLDQALGLIKEAAGQRWDNSPELMDQLVNILERKFQ